MGAGKVGRVKQLRYSTISALPIECVGGGELSKQGSEKMDCG